MLPHTCWPGQDKAFLQMCVAIYLPSYVRISQYSQGALHDHALQEDNIIFILFTEYIRKKLQYDNKMHEYAYK